MLCNAVPCMRMQQELILCVLFVDTLSYRMKGLRYMYMVLATTTPLVMLMVFTNNVSHASQQRQHKLNSRIWNGRKDSTHYVVEPFFLWITLSTRMLELELTSNPQNSLHTNSPVVYLSFCLYVIYESLSFNSLHDYCKCY